MKTLKIVLLGLTASVVSLSSNLQADIMPAPAPIYAPVSTEDRIKQLEAEIEQLKTQIKPLKEQLKLKERELRQLKRQLRGNSNR